MILAPLRGVTIRCFRETFAKEINEYGFTEAVTPFITANAGLDPLKDRELISVSPVDASLATLLVTPQFIGKDPAALRYCLERIKSVGYTTADINCGCPFPMVRNKGRGSGILRTSDVLAKMLEVGCEVMGERKFSMKARLGVERKDELLQLVSGDTAPMMPSGQQEDGVQVIIGSENPVIVMDNSALVFKPVKKDGRTVGALGVIGPTRMNYTKVISMIDSITDGISDVLDTKDGN